MLAAAATLRRGRDELRAAQRAISAHPDAQRSARLKPGAATLEEYVTLAGMLAEVVAEALGDVSRACQALSEDAHMRPDYVRKLVDDERRDLAAFARHWAAMSPAEQRADRERRRALGIPQHGGDPQAKASRGPSHEAPRRAVVAA